MKNHIQPYIDEIIAGKQRLALSIYDDIGNTVGEMRPLTKEHLCNPDIVNIITYWRNLNMHCFLTQFVATPERTVKWLENIVFKVPGQMLFLLYEKNNLVGHLGFKSLTKDDGVLDNAIKGEKTIDPKLLVYAHKALAEWLFDTAKIKHLYGYVLTDNAPAIMMNRQIGWNGWVRVPLLKVENSDEVAWRLGDENQFSPDNKYCYKIELSRNL